MMRFDYSGHGESGGDFRRRHHRPLAGGKRRGVRRLLPGPQVLVGSSMGGWLALLLARELRAAARCRRRRRSRAWC